MISTVWPTPCLACDARDGPLCPACAPTRLLPVAATPALVAQTWTCAAYDQGLGQALRVAKYRPSRAAARALARHLALATLNTPEVGRVAIVVPAPSTLWTRVRRGFSLSALLAHAVGQARSRPIANALRVTRGRRQAGLGARARRDNLRGRVHACRGVSGRVALIDDVITTGATATACAQALLQAGASEIVLVSLCLAGRDPQTVVQNP